MFWVNSEAANFFQSLCRLLKEDYFVSCMLCMETIVDSEFQSRTVL